MRSTPARGPDDAQRANNHALRLDYVRGDLFDTTAMRDVAASAIGDPNLLDDRLSEVLERAIRTDGAEIFAFGNPWGPEHKADSTSTSNPGAACTICT